MVLNLNSYLMNRTFVGDIFIVRTDVGIRFFQFIGKDKCLLGADVIRIFSRTYNNDSIPTVEIVLNDRIECYMHTSVSAGVKLNYWEKFASSKELGQEEVFFRSSKDDLNGSHKGIVSKRWIVWKMNGERLFVGELPISYQNADLGIVYAPKWVFYRIETGLDIEAKNYPRY